MGIYVQMKCCNLIIILLVYDSVFVYDYLSINETFN